VPQWRHILSVVFWCGVRADRPPFREPSSNVEDHAIYITGGDSNLRPYTFHYSATCHPYHLPNSKPWRLLPLPTLKTVSLPLPQSSQSRAINLRAIAGSIDPLSCLTRTVVLRGSAIAPFALRTPTRPKRKLSPPLTLQSFPKESEPSSKIRTRIAKTPETGHYTA
jgi:hypothetical protein